MIYCFHDVGKNINKYVASPEDLKVFLYTHASDEIHFDDGRKGILTYGREIVNKLYKKPTIFIVPNFLLGIVPLHERYSEFLNIEEVKILLKDGWKLGSHSMTHPDLTVCSQRKLVKEIKGSKEWLEKIFETKIEDFAFPYGKTTKEISEYALKVYKNVYTLDSPLGTKRTLVVSDVC